MEHIRAAIDKARQERLSGKKPGTSPPRQAGGAAAKTDDAALLLEWQALHSFEVNPKQLKRNRITTYQANPQATPFDAMRTKLLHEMRSNSWSRVAITSPGTNCGKSTVCLNLAFSMARQSDLRIMVIELDFRRPSIARTLQLHGNMNFARVLAGEASAGDHMIRHGLSLAIAPSQRTPNSAELLQGVTAAHVIDKIEARYQPDVMLFDVPPMLVVDDTMAFIDQVDATLLVGAAETSTMNEVNRCKQDLEARTNLIGVVLNKCRYLDPTESHGYGN